MAHLNLIDPDTAQGELKDQFAAVKQTFFGKASRIDIDFPRAPALAKAA
jgi:hypothetical protein